MILYTKNNSFCNRKCDSYEKSCLKTALKTCSGQKPGFGGKRFGLGIYIKKRTGVLNFMVAQDARHKIYDRFLL